MTHVQITTAVSFGLSSKLILLNEIFPAASDILGLSKQITCFPVQRAVGLTMAGVEYQNVIWHRSILPTTGTTRPGPKSFLLRQDV